MHEELIITKNLEFKLYQIIAVCELTFFYFFFQFLLPGPVSRLYVCSYLHEKCYAEIINKYPSDIERQEYNLLHYLFIYIYLT